MQNDQTVKKDAGKLKITLVPTQIIRDIAEVREYGCTKYQSEEKWKTVEKQRYIDALCRHLLAYIDDPTGVDEESGIPHYKHMACNMAFICHLEARANETVPSKGHDGCTGCRFEDCTPTQAPCIYCVQSYQDRYSPKHNDGKMTVK